MRWGRSSGYRSPSPFRESVMSTVHSVDEALEAAQEAKANCSLARFPSACVVLADALKKANEELDVLKAQIRDESKRGED